MKINEIKINQQDLLVERLINESAMDVYLIYQNIEKLSQNFRDHANNVFSHQDIVEISDDLRNLSKIGDKHFNSTHQTPKIIAYLLSYLSGL